MQWLTTGNTPWPALVGVRSDGSLTVGPRARRIADTQPGAAIAPMEVLAAVREGALPSGLPVSGWGPEGGIVALGDHRFEFYDVLLAWMRGLKEMLERELPDRDFRAFFGIPAPLETGPAGMLRSAVREAGFDEPEFQPVVESLVRAFGLEDRAVDDVVIVHVEETHAVIARAERAGHRLAVSTSEVDRSVSTRAIDDAATELALESLNEHHGEGFADDPIVLARLRDALDFARSDLRRSPTLELRTTLPAPGGASGVGLERNIQLARSRVYAMTETLSGALHRRVLELVRNRPIGPERSAVIVSGPGGSYPPFVRVVEQLCGQAPLASIPPPHALATGLARWGRSRTQSAVAERPDTLDASIGIELPGGRFRPLLPAGAQLPLHYQRQQPVRVHKDQVELVLYQGDSEYVKGCDYLGSLAVASVSADARGGATIELDMQVDAEGVLQARMAEPISGRGAQLVAATAQTPDARRRTIPVPVRRAPGAGAPSGEDAASGGLFRRLFGKK